MGVNYTDMYAPVVQHATCRSAIALALRNGYQMTHLDVKTAFLYADLEDEVYMEAPKGFGTRKDFGCRLLKSIYGLEQAPRMWYKKISASLTGLAFIQSNADENAFLCENNNGKMVLALYVDDCLFVGNDMNEMRRVEKELSMDYSMKNLGALSHFLGVQIIRTDRYISLTQRQ